MSSNAYKEKDLKNKDRKVTKTCHFCKKASSYVYQDEPKKCPFCKELYWNKGSVEIKLHTLQEEYLKTKDRKVYEEFFYEMRDLTFNIICGKLKNTYQYKDKDSIEDMVHDSLFTMLSYYATKPNFRVKNSFTEYISQVVLYPLYNKKKKRREKKELSIFTPLQEVSSSKERTLLDKLRDTEDTYNTEDLFFRPVYREQLHEEVISFTKDIFRVYLNKWGFREAFKILILVTNYIDGAKMFYFNYWWSKEDLFLRQRFERLQFVLKLRIEQQVTVKKKTSYKAYTQEELDDLQRKREEGEKIKQEKIQEKIKKGIQNCEFKYFKTRG